VTRWARILVTDPQLVADEAVIAGLTAAHHEVRVCVGVHSAAREVAAFRPDLLIMGLPVGDPTRVTTAVRRALASSRPLLLCMLDDGPSQRAPALEAGADSCLDKPCTVEELELHTRVLLRRAPWLERSVRQLGPLVIDEDAHEILVGGRPIDLCAKEFGLLAMLAQHSGAVLSKRALLEGLWGFDAYDENLVEVQMCALRRHLPPDVGRMIHTIRGVGYVLRDELPRGSSRSQELGCTTVSVNLADAPVPLTVTV
jgi:DNA-binding response OmpR family regulator